VSYAAIDSKALRVAKTLGGWEPLELPQPIYSSQRRLSVARATTRYISLLQPLGVKSRIQNFDEADGKIGLDSEPTQAQRIF